MASFRDCLALLNMAKRQPKSPEVHFFLALHFLREHQPAKALSAFEAAAAAVAALPEERMSQPRRDLHSAAHRHMAQCHLELAMLAAPAAAETDPHHHHHNQHLNASQQQHPHKQQKQHQQNHQQQQQQHAAHANDADVAGGAPITVHKQSSSKVQGKAQGKDQVNAQGKVEGKVQAKAQLKGPRRGAKMQQQAQKKGEKRGKREREKAETGLMRPAEKHGEEWSLPEMDQEGGLSGKRKFEGEGAIEGVTNGLDELDGLLGLAGLVEEEAEGREAKRVCSALDMFAAVADLELRREERLREERQREEACLLQQDSAGVQMGGEVRMEVKCGGDLFEGHCEDAGGAAWGGAFVAEENVGEERVEEDGCEAVEEEEGKAGEEEEEREEEEDAEQQVGESPAVEEGAELTLGPGDVEGVGSLKKAAERGGMATTNHLAVMLLLYGRTEKALDVLSQQLASVETGTSGDAAGSTGSTASPTAPIDTDTLANLGAALLHVGRYDEAAACLQAVLQREPQHPAALCSYSALLLATQRCHGRRLDRKAGSKLDHMQQQKPQVEQKLELQQDLQQQEQVQQRQDEEKERAPNAGVVVDVTETEGAELAPAATGTAGADATIEGGESRVVFSAAAGDLAGVSAQQCATAAVQLLPSCGFLWCNLAHAATRSGRWKQAAKCMSQALKLQPASAPLRFAAAAHRIATAAAAPLPPALASQHIRCGVAEMADAMGLPELTYGSNGVPTFSRDGASAIIFGTGAGAGPGATGAGTNVASAGAAGAFGGCHGGNRKSVLSHVPEWMAWDVVGHAHAALERRALQEIVTKTGAFVVEEEARLTVTGCSDGGSAQEGLGEEEMERGGGGNRLMALLVGAASRGEDGDGEEDEEKRCKEEEEEEEGFGSGDGGGSGEAVNEELACAVVQAEELKLAAWKKQSLMAAAGAGTGAHQLGVHALHSAIHSLASDMGDGTTMGGAAADIRDANGAVELSSTGYFAAAHSHFLRALSRHQQSTATWSSLGRLSAALSAAHNALLLAPMHGPSLCSFALLSATAGRWKDAVDAFQRASEVFRGVQGGVERGEVVGEDGGVMEGRASAAAVPKAALMDLNEMCDDEADAPSLGAAESAARGAENPRNDDGAAATLRSPEEQGAAAAVRGESAGAVHQIAAPKAASQSKDYQSFAHNVAASGFSWEVFKLPRPLQGSALVPSKGKDAGGSLGQGLHIPGRLNGTVLSVLRRHCEANGRNEMAGPAAERASQYAAGEIPAAAAAAAPGGGAGAAATNGTNGINGTWHPTSGHRNGLMEAAQNAVKSSNNPTWPNLSHTNAALPLANSVMASSAALNASASSATMAPKRRVLLDLEMPACELSETESGGNTPLGASTLCGRGNIPGGGNMRHGGGVPGEALASGPSKGNAFAGANGFYGSGGNAAAGQGGGLRSQQPEAMVSEHAAERAVNGFHVAPRSAGGRDTGSDRNRLPDLNDWLTAS
ncbi:unnamed protein product [Closterium sp. NIES-64]|nr:unnamed protein product [Closterium sp. NIES-64]